jgi:YbbR-like protein
MGTLLENLPLKAASLLLAIVLWFVIAGEKTSERGMDVPVELQNFPQNLELTGDPVNRVEVRLRASPGIIHAVGPGEISAQVNLAGAGEGERIIHLTPEAIRVPFGVRVVKITPAILTLNFERTLFKTVPVRPRLIGRPAQGYEVAEVTSDPPEVRIAGPKSRVQEVESAFTEPVSVEGVDVSVTDRVSIGLEDPVLRLQGASRVQVLARIREESGKRAFDALPVEVRGGSGLARPATVRLVVSGPLALLKQLRPSHVHAYVSLVDTPAPAGLPRLPVAVELDSGFGAASVSDIEPAEVTVRPTRARSSP